MADLPYNFYSFKANGNTEYEANVDPNFNMANLGSSPSKISRDEFLAGTQGKSNYANIYNTILNSAPSGYTTSGGTLTTDKAVSDEAANQAAVAAGTMKAVPLGSGTAYEPTGSAADKLTSGIASGAVSPTNPTQQFDASMQGNNVNAPGVVPNAPALPTLANGQQAGGLQMPMGDAANSVFNPDTGQQEIPGSKQGLANAQASGQPAPQSSGEARSAVAQYTPPPAPPGPNTAAIDQTLANDPGYQQLLKDRAEYTSATNQQQSLTKTYTDLSNQLGIPALNTELMNMKNIIDGTEDDIRAEVTKAGGFATNSQVLALTDARNKQMIQNYNNLLQVKNQAMDTLNTMVGLAGQDRQYAMQSIQQKLQIDEQINSYRDKMQTNAQQTYQNIVNTVGYTGLAQMTGGDPYYTSLIEKTLGLQPGQLQTLANTQQYQANAADLKAAGVTTPYANVSGEIRNTKTGESYTSEAEFQSRTGMSLADAQSKGLISNVGGSTADEKKLVLDMASKYVDAGIKPTDSLAVAQSKLANSKIYKDQVRGPVGSGGGSGGGTPKLTATSLIDAFKTGWTKEGYIQGNGKISSKDYKEAKQQFRDAGFTGAAFDNAMSDLIDKSGSDWKGDYGYGS